VDIKKQGTFLMNNGRGKMHWMQLAGRLWVKKYTGIFSVKDLQAKADTGLWFTYGQPDAVQGEGRTPEAALSDSMRRTQDKINKMKDALSVVSFAKYRCPSSKLVS
jgi:hypothetical protein